MVKEEITAVWWLTPFLSKESNMFQIRHQLLTLIMFLVLVIMMSSTFNYHMILISLWNLNYKIVTSVTFLFIILYNTFYLIPVTSRHLLFTWLNILRIKKLTWLNLIRSMTCKVLAKLLGNLSLPSIILDKTHLSQIFITTSWDKRYHSIVPQRLT